MSTTKQEGDIFDNVESDVENSDLGTKISTHPSELKQGSYATYDWSVPSGFSPYKSASETFAKVYTPGLDSSPVTVNNSDVGQESDLPFLKDVTPNNQRLVLIVDDSQPNPDGSLHTKVCNRENYLVISNNSSHILAGMIVDDISYDRRLIYDQEGHILDEYIISENDSIFYDIHSMQDMWNGHDISDLVLKANLGKISENKSEAKLMLTPEMVSLIRKNPKGFADRFIYMKKASELDKLTRINKLLSILLLEEGQFDEQFVVVESVPKSFKLKTYIDNLAELVSKEMDEKDEIGDLDVLRKEAYKTVDFKQPIEAVIEAAEEYNDYFKFKMVKDEKIIVTKAEFEEVNKSVEAIKDNNYYKTKFTQTGGNKMIARKELFVDKVTSSGRFGLSVRPDGVKRVGDYKHMNITKLIKIPRPLTDFPKLISALGLDLEIAITNKCAISYFSKEIANKWKINHSFLVIDDCNNIFAFEVKPATLTKWDKKLNEELDKVAYHIDGNNYKLPWEFHNISMTI